MRSILLGARQARQEETADLPTQGQESASVPGVCLPGLNVLAAT